MSSKTCDQCGKCFTSIHRTTCYVCKPTTGPSKAQMLAMAGLEDDCGSCSVGGMAVDLGLYPTVEQADDMAAVIAELQQKLDAANARVAELERERDEAIRMLAEWCVMVQINGSGWDDWDEAYKDAAYRPCGIRELIDDAIDKEKARWKEEYGRE